MQTQELVVIAEFNSYLEAELAKSIVASAGIYTEIRNEYMSTAYAVAIPPQKDAFSIKIVLISSHDVSYR